MRHLGDVKLPPTPLPSLPLDSTPHTSIRKQHIQNLVDLLHACLLRGDIPRAQRAWSILIRCREVDWKSRWRWGLALLSAVPSERGSGSAQVTGIDSRLTRHDQARKVEQWLRSLRISITEDEKPAVLHALILHLIEHHQHREALDELETYLTSYPYLLCVPLHVYAGMLSFYLAQPLSARAPAQRESSLLSGSAYGEGNGEEHAYPQTSSGGAVRAEANQTLLDQARRYFVKAVEMGDDTVSTDYIRMIDTGSYDARGTSPDDSLDESRQSDDHEMSHRHRRRSFSGTSHAEDGDDTDSDDEDDNDAESDDDDDSDSSDGIDPSLASYR